MISTEKEHFCRDDLSNPSIWWISWLFPRVYFLWRIPSNWDFSCWLVFLRWSISSAWACTVDCPTQLICTWSQVICTWIFIFCLMAKLKEHSRKICWGHPHEKQHLLLRLPSLSSFLLDHLTGHAQIGHLNIKVPLNLRQTKWFQDSEDDVFDKLTYFLWILTKQSDSRKRFMMVRTSFSSLVLADSNCEIILSISALPCSARKAFLVKWR